VHQQVAQFFHRGVIRFETPLFGFFRGLQVLQVCNGGIHFEVIAFPLCRRLHAIFDSSLMRLESCLFCFKYFLGILQLSSFFGLKPIQKARHSSQGGRLLGRRVTHNAAKQIRGDDPVVPTLGLDAAACTND
jgi:hypothetical protein